MNRERITAVVASLFLLIVPMVVFSNIQTVDGNPERGFFLTWDNFRFIAAQAVTVSVAALGMTLIMAGGGIDLSVGAVIALSGGVGAIMLHAGHSPFLAILAGIVAGAGAGLANGMIICGFRVAPAIATLGMLGVIRGVAFWLSSGKRIAIPATWFDGVMAFAPADGWTLFAPGVWIALVVAGAMGVLAQNTVFGRHVFAIGSSEATARMCGIRVPFVKVMTYVAAGALFGLAGLLQMARLRLGDAGAGVGMEVDVIAASFIGGASLRGGTGSVAGTLIGALFLAILRNGSQQAGWPPYVHEGLAGLALVLAAATATWRRRCGDAD